MSFFAIKTNPFTDWGERWEGVGVRAGEAADVAAEEASNVLLAKIQERGPKYSGFNRELLAQTRAMRDDATGSWRVGIPDDSAAAAEARELEYGAGDLPPQALMRTSERKSSKEAQAVFSQVLLDELFGEGE